MRPDTARNAAESVGRIIKVTPKNCRDRFRIRPMADKRDERRDFF